MHGESWFIPQCDRLAGELLIGVQPAMPVHGRNRQVASDKRIGRQLSSRPLHKLTVKVHLQSPTTMVVRKTLTVERHETQIINLVGCHFPPVTFELVLGLAYAHSLLGFEYVG